MAVSWRERLRIVPDVLIWCWRCWKSRVLIRKAVSHRLLTAETRVQSKARPYQFYGEESGTGTVFLRLFRSCLFSSIPPVLHTHSFIYHRCYTTWAADDSPVESQSWKMETDCWWFHCSSLRCLKKFFYVIQHDRYLVSMKYLWLYYEEEWMCSSTLSLTSELGVGGLTCYSFRASLEEARKISPPPKFEPQTVQPSSS